MVVRFALPAGSSGLERCEHNLKPRNPRVFKLGFLLSQREKHSLTKENDAPEPRTAGLTA